VTFAAPTIPETAGSAPPLVRFDHVSASYGGPAVLDDVSLTIARGAFVGVVGPSGAGKTTLLKAMVGGVPRLRGTVTVDGRVIGSGRNQGVGWVPQLETVDWSFPATVREVVLMGRWGRSPWRPWMSKEDRADADRVLDRLGIGGLGERQIRQLSGGQQQRVFLARAMIGDPVLLLLDEPTSGVDLKTRDEVLHLLADLNRAGVTIVMTTHELNSVAAHLPWVVCVNRRIVAEGDPDRIFTAPVLNATYNADLRIVRQDGAILVADAAPHTLRDALRHRHDGYEHAHHEHDHAPHVHPHEHGDAADPAPVPHEHEPAPVPHEHEGVPHVHPQGHAH
jgi:zinc/manganese transport system ATP-binding protein/zinc transport system ATP-binding protein